MDSAKGWKAQNNRVAQNNRKGAVPRMDFNGIRMNRFRVNRIRMSRIGMGRFRVSRIRMEGRF